MHALSIYFIPMSVQEIEANEDYLLLRDIATTITTTKHELHFR